MPLHYTRGDMFEGVADAYVVTCNNKATGINSAGVAGQAYNRWPNIHAQYLDICKDKACIGGTVWERRVGEVGPIIFLAFTKEDWRLPSKVLWVKECARLLSVRLEDFTGTIHMPKMGCGNGKLSWKVDVKPLYEDYFSDLPGDIRVF